MSQARWIDNQTWYAMIWKVLVALVALLLALLALTYENIVPPWSIVMVSIAIAGFVVSIVLIVQENRSAVFTSSTGTFRPFERHYNKYIQGMPDAMTIRFGKSDKYITWIGHVLDSNPDFTKPQKVFEGPNDDYSIYFWFDAGQLRMRMKLYDLNLNLIGQIDGNEWYVNKSLGYTICFDDGAIEVRNLKGVVQLQVVMYANLIQLAYFNYGPQGGHENIDGLVRPFDPKHGPQAAIAPIFEFPQKKYPGKRLGS